MKIHLDTGSGRQIVRDYAPGRVRIGEEIYEHSVILTSDGAVTHWTPQHFGELTEAALAPLVAIHPEVILIGTGTALRFPPPDWLAPSLAAHIGIECMDTGAACRTYNLLAGEGRTVVAALLLADPPSRPPIR